MAKRQPKQPKQPQIPCVPTDGQWLRRYATIVADYNLTADRFARFVDRDREMCAMEPPAIVWQLLGDMMRNETDTTPRDLAAYLVGAARASDDADRLFPEVD